MSDLVIRAHGLGKRYDLGRSAPYESLREALASALAAPWRRLVGRGGSELRETLWALRDVSFEVAEGEVLGVIGPNGAGKSTLQRVLSGITEPTEGWADLRGRVASLLEVGTGFHPELSGRENVYLNGAILGMTRAEVRARFDAIVAFAGVERFIDMPAKHYSSGLYMRLAFAVAAHLEPEILLVDEVLAVGDAAFQRKCLGTMEEVARSGRTVLLVSHNMGAVSRLCRRTLWLETGRVRQLGPTEEVVAAYLTSSAVTEGERRWEGGLSWPGERAFRLHAVAIRNARAEATSRVDIRKPFTVEIRYSVLERLPFARVGFVISTPQGVAVFDAYDSDDERYSGPREVGEYAVRCEVPGDLLVAERYVLSVNAGVPNVRNLAQIDGALVLDVEDTGGVGCHVPARREGVVRPRLRWEQEMLDPLNVVSAEAQP